LGLLNISCASLTARGFVTEMTRSVNGFAGQFEDVMAVKNALPC